ncbi:M15 family metallopeptidase [Cellulomonas bogoriensis]|uniref:D-Ala-D-Ala carboxypeptidase n=1 Tax=Cellulomonas bogoriensis 69B4 = DSM 16987 TaxID=1386082 RepID=A0A0A0BZ03_9CELL|nr:M15 family metallopeptidase [Cellulomonas bogoriensis]KGM13628.1 D-Ala-D-Ala carboxypeptidase [Cellulomonas bogoriensis 69B4 = DSM 16987]
MLLAALGAATIAVPVADMVAPDNGLPGPTARHVDLGYPTPHEVLASPVHASTSLLPAVRGVRPTSESASRSLDRDPLPGCDGDARTTGSNGQIPASDLCSLWEPNHMLRGDAAVALAELNTNFRAVYGRDLCLTDSYRPLAVQRRLAQTKPTLAATPGRSNHGWGLAVDLCNTVTGNASAMEWLRANGPTYGWDNPPWARRGGSGPYEPWHWEYTPGTTAMGSNWS